MLKFSEANAKLNGLASIIAFVEGILKQGDVYSFDLPAGHTCPGANKCKSAAVETPEGWRIKDGPRCEFRCYSASQEVVLPSLRQLRWNNLKELRRLKTPERMAKAILQSIPANCAVIRLHTSGDFFSRAYFKAWLMVAHDRPDLIIYAYTKAIHLWMDHERAVEMLDNFRLVASIGGRYDHLIPDHYRTCTVVLSHEEAEEKGLKIDHDDSFAVGLKPDQHFAVLIHGTQPLGSEQGKAVYRLRKLGLNGYRKSDRGYGLKKRKACHAG